MSNGSWIENKVGAPGVGLPVLPPRSALIELVVIVLAIAGVDWLLPNQDLSDIGPNPYWLPVLLMSLQYGTVSGLLAAGVGIAMTMLPGVPEQGVGENHFAYLLRIWAQPILWIAVAVLLGQFRIRQIAAKRELMRQVQELSAQRQALADYSTNLRIRCEAVEREIAGRSEPAAQELLAAVAHLAHPGGELGAALARVVGLAAPGAEASVYLVDGAWLRKVADSGWRGDQTRAEELTAVHPLYRAVIERGESVSVLVPAHDALLSGEGLAAVPIRIGDGGPASGMLKLDAAPAGAVSAATLDALAAIALAVAQRFGAGSAVRSEVAVPAGQPEARTMRGFFGRSSSWLRRAVTPIAPQPAPPAGSHDGDAAHDGQADGSGARPRAVR